MGEVEGDGSTNYSIDFGSSGISYPCRCPREHPRAYVHVFSHDDADGISQMVDRMADESGGECMKSTVDHSCWYAIQTNSITTFNPEQQALSEWKRKTRARFTIAVPSRWIPSRMAMSCPESVRTLR